MQVASIDNTDSPEQQKRNVTNTGTASEEKKATPEAANDTSLSSAAGSGSGTNLDMKRRLSMLSGLNGSFRKKAPSIFERR